MSQRKTREIEKPAKIRIYQTELEKYEKELSKMSPEKKISKEGNRRETLVATIKNLKFQLSKLQ